MDPLLLKVVPRFPVAADPLSVADPPDGLHRPLVQRGSVTCSDTWTSCTRIAAKDSGHCVADHGNGEHSTREGAQINGL